MPIQDFALDTQGSQYVQVFWNSESEPTTVRLNDKVIGLLNTGEERTKGKDFSLPDGSTLNVRLIDNQARVTHNGSPLGGIRRVVRSPRRPPEGKKLGGCLTTWLVVMLIGDGSTIITNFLQFIGATKSYVFQQSPVFLLLYLLLSCAGIVCAIALLSWKKWGFYLFLYLAACNIILYYLEHLFDHHPFSSGVGLNILTFIWPFIGVGLLYWLLRRNDVWEQMA